MFTGVPGYYFKSICIRQTHNNYSSPLYACMPTVNGCLECHANIYNEGNRIGNRISPCIPHNISLLKKQLGNGEATKEL